VGLAVSSIILFLLALAIWCGCDRDVLRLDTEEDADVVSREDVDAGEGIVDSDTHEETIPPDPGVDCLATRTPRLNWPGVAEWTFEAVEPEFELECAGERCPELVLSWSTGVRADGASDFSFAPSERSIVIDGPQSLGRVSIETGTGWRYNAAPQAQDFVGCADCGSAIAFSSIHVLDRELPTERIIVALDATGHEVWRLCIERGGEALAVYSPEVLVAIVDWTEPATNEEREGVMWISTRDGSVLGRTEGDFDPGFQTYGRFGLSVFDERVWVNVFGRLLWATPESTAFDSVELAGDRSRNGLGVKDANPIPTIDGRVMVRDRNRVGVVDPESGETIAVGDFGDRFGLRGTATQHPMGTFHMPSDAGLVRVLYDGESIAVDGGHAGVIASHPPAVTRDGIGLLGIGGGVVALDLTDYSEIWRIRWQDVFHQAPILLDDGTMVLISESGILSVWQTDHMGLADTPASFPYFDITRSRRIPD
jgi:hypothetical protein